ncbi:MAG: SLC13 family permease [Planctomycetota bacterium]|jgi:di/tricarboxylate transporter
MPVLRVGRAQKPLLAVGAFAAALGAAAMGLLPAAVALTAVVLLYAITNIVTVRKMYEAVDWSIIVLLGAMLPVGEALQSSGGSERLAGLLESLAGSLPDFAMLALLLIITMTLSDIINNAATVVLMAPIGLSLAGRLEMNPDAFLMAVAVGASCAFLTPIGHQCNTLVLGPGGYQFRDYWRLGLPLEILIVLVSVPLIMMVWP